MSGVIDILNSKRCQLAGTILCMNKRAITGLVVLGALLLIGGFYYNRAQIKNAGLLLYKDQDKVFSFLYPKEFSVSGRKENLLAIVRIPREYLPGTNFSEAWLDISFSNAPADMANCPGRESQTDAGAGNFYETTVVKKVFDGDCYAFAYTIHSTNIGNYSPDQGIREFDKGSVVQKMEGIIESFKYLVDSN